MKKGDEKINLYVNKLVKFLRNIGYNFNGDIKIIINTSDIGDTIFTKTSEINYYTKEITVFTNGRHLKDILRNISCDYMKMVLYQDKSGYTSDKITEDNKLIRLEAEAYLKGNMAFRSWTETEQKKGKLR